MKIVCLSLFLFFFNLSSFSQQSGINGTVKDKESNQAIPFCNVFLEGTTRGTQTDSLGKFSLQNVALGSYRLVVSIVGYSPIVYPITITEKPLNFKFLLEIDTKLLEAVTVKGKRDKGWEKNFKEFERLFLGMAFDPKEVKIVNPEVIDFSKDKGVFSATASKDIVIENRTLGYKITYILQDFSKTSELVSYIGLARFQELTPNSEKQKKTWLDNRKEVYEGSITHFLKSLIDDNIRAQGFDAFFMNPDYVNNTNISTRFYDIVSKRHLPIITKEVVSETSSKYYEIKFPFLIELVYNKRYARSAFSDAPYPYSQLIQKSKILVSKNGVLANPFALEIRGEMAKPSIADLLPIDLYVE